MGLMQYTAFNLFTAIIFGLAIINTFLTPTLYSTSTRLAHLKGERPKYWKRYHFLSEIFYLLSEVEVIFGLWLIPLMMGYTFFVSWGDALNYVQNIDYTGPLYIMVIVAVVSSRPIITFAERILEYVARLGKDTPAAWWWTILSVGPLFGALMKEPGAMTLCSILLVKKFYIYNPSRPFKYATLALLFANVSIGGMLTPFASRALFMIAAKWEWGTADMLKMFGWKAMIGITLANLVYFFCFRKDFSRFPKKLPTVEKGKPLPPLWITFIHLTFLTFIAVMGEYAPVFLGIFILFLGFHRATMFYQTPLHLKSAILVGFFFASLIIHGGLQDWWIHSLLINPSPIGLFSSSLILSAFADNAIVIYLAAKIPEYSELFRYLLVSGAMVAGGLTVIANAPNPIGHAILRHSFQENISFSRLFLAALLPTGIMASIFWILQ